LSGRGIVPAVVAIVAIGAVIPVIVIAIAIVAITVSIINRGIYRSCAIQALDP
jgi:hypothetical protein